MAANVETMMYVREKPWHGLGTKVDEAPTSKEALEMAGLNWTITSNPVYDGNGIVIPGYKANTRDTDGKVIGIVSGRYQIVQNTEAFEFTDSLIGGEVKYETAGSLKGGRQIWLLARMPNRKIAGDDFEPYICFTNTHDGSGAVRACMTPVRVVCNNTLNMALSGAKRSWSARHLGNIQSKLEEARQTLELADEYLEKLSEEAEILAGEKFTDAQAGEALSKLFPVEKGDTPRQIRTAENAQAQIVAMMYRPDLLRFMNTKWGFVNAVADYVGHGEPARKTKGFAENRWSSIISGYTILDKAVALTK